MEEQIPQVEDAAEAIEPPLPFFLKSQTPFWKYVLIMGGISLAGSLIVTSLFSRFIDDEAIVRSLSTGGTAEMVLGAVIVSPVLESLLLALTISGLSFKIKEPYRLAAAAAVLWAALHAIVVPSWALGVVWPFFIFSLSYLSWRRKSLLHGLAAATAVHMIQNLPPILLVAATAP